MRSIRRNAFQSDAAFFELIAREAASAEDRKHYRKIAATYRALSKEETTGETRHDHWHKRAEECRTLADQFQHEACRAQLLRLAGTYDMLATTSNEPAEVLARIGDDPMPA